MLFQRMFPAAKVSQCPHCGNTVEVGAMIAEVKRPYVEGMKRTEHGVDVKHHVGTYPHAGCVWDDRQGSAPFMTWEQINGLLRVIRNLDLTGDGQMTRLQGACLVAMQQRKTRRFPKDMPETAPALELGTDLLDGLQKILTRVEGRGHFVREWWQPKNAQGEIWQDPRLERPTPVPNGNHLSAVIDRSRSRVSDSLRTLEADRIRLLPVARRMLAEVYGNERTDQQAMLDRLESRLIRCGAEVRWNGETQTAEWRTASSRWAPIPEQMVELPAVGR